MPNTTNRNYSVPVTGTEVDTWGDTLNANFALIDNNIGGVSSVALSNVNVTLNSAQAACGTIRLSGTLSGNCLVLFPNVSGWWTIDNQCAGNFYVAARLAAGGNQIGIPPGEVVDVLADGTNMKFRNLGRVATYEDFAETTVPLWISACTVPPLLLCDGSSFSAVTYPFLNTKLGGTTLPDFRGRMAAFLNGGTGRITTAGSGIDGDTRFSAGGAQNVVLLQANLPNLTLTTTIASGQGSHSHTSFEPTGQNAAEGTSGSGGINRTSQPTSTATLPAMTGTTPTGGSGTAVNEMPPTCIAGIRMIYAA